MKRVYDAKDRIDAHMMAHALEENRIRAQVRGEFDTELRQQPTVWIVDDEDYEKAIRIVDEIIESNESREEPSEPTTRRRPTSGSRVFMGIVLGFILGTGVAALLYILDIPEGIKPANRSDYNGDGVVDTWVERKGREVISVAYDTNLDGKPDNWTSYKNYMIELAAYDDNFDGKADGWTFYNTEGMAERVEDDVDFDGRVDAWKYYKDAQPSEEAFDNDRDDKKDEWSRLENGRVVERKWSYLEDGIIDKKAIYRNGRKVEELYDRDRNGKFDESVTFDEFERVVRRVKL